MLNPKDRLTAFLMLLPSLVLLAIFVYFFIFQTVQASTTDWGENPEKPPLAENVEKASVGLDNYQNLMTDFTEFPFRNSLINTFFFTLFFVGGCIVLGFLLALLIDQRIRFEGVFRTVFLFPMALSFVVTGTIWRWMLQPNGGINILPEKLLGLKPLTFSWITSREVLLRFTWGDVPLYLTYFGLAVLGFLAFNYVSNRNWRSTQVVAAGIVILLVAWFAGLWDEVWLPLDQADLEPSIAPKGYNAALSGIIIAAVWQMSGYTMAMFLAGIRGIPEELREAARVDGATELGVYWRIVLPQLKPITLSAVIVLGHISLKIFDLVFAMSGPDNAQTVVPGLLVYTRGFRANRFATGAATAVVMLFLVSLVIIPYLWYSLRDNRREA